jgi:hypothetical protein
MTSFGATSEEGTSMPKTQKTTLPAGMITRDQAEQIIRAYERKIRDLKNKLLMIPDRMPADLPDVERQGLATIIRETVRELSEQPVPGHIKNEYPDLARRLEQMNKVWLEEN